MVVECGTQRNPACEPMHDCTEVIGAFCCSCSKAQSATSGSLPVTLLCADGYRGSIKMHKDAGGPLVLGPIWDLNEAFGLCCGYPIEGGHQSICYSLKTVSQSNCLVDVHYLKQTICQCDSAIASPTLQEPLTGVLCP